jgi:hypothetical protein
MDSSRSGKWTLTGFLNTQYLTSGFHVVNRTMKLSASQQGLCSTDTVNCRVSSKPLFTLISVTVCCDVTESSQHIKASTVTWLRTYEHTDLRIRRQENRGSIPGIQKKLPLSQSVQNALSGSYQNGTSAYFPNGRSTLLLRYPVTSVLGTAAVTWCNYGWKLPMR